MSSFKSDVASVIRGAGLTTGATAGAAAGGAVVSSVTSAAGGTAMTIALGANPIFLAGALFVGLTYGGWWVAKKLSEPLDSD